MFYLLDTTSGDEKAFEIIKKDDLWTRVQYKAHPKFGIGVLTREDFSFDDFIDLNGEEYAKDILVKLTDIPVTASFNRKTLAPYIMKANKFENDIFIAAFDCGDMELVNHSIRFTNLIDYYQDKKRGRMILIFTMRRGYRDDYGYTSISESFMKNVDGKQHWLSYCVTYEPSTASFIALKNTVTTTPGQKPDKKHVPIRMNKNIQIENGNVRLRKYYPSRPTWTVILTQASKEQEVRDVLESRYNMKDKRLNLVVAKSNEMLKQVVGKLRHDNITAVTYYIDKFENTQEVRKNLDSVRESIDTNFYGDQFQKTFVLSPNGDATYIRV